MYMLSRCNVGFVYSLPFCRPSGWDSDKKISILAENLMTIKADEEFETVIKRPPTLRRPANRDGEVAADDDQDFLNRCHNLLAKGNKVKCLCPRLRAVVRVVMFTCR